MEAMSSEVREAFATIIREEGAEPYFGYSGRGMYGKSCFGLLTGMNLLDLGMALGRAGLEGEVKAKTDNLGLSTIVYFPDIAGDEEDEAFLRDVYEEGL